MDKKCFDIVVVTNLPSFYKINLYNLIAEHRRIFVIYTGHADRGRNEDFFKGKASFGWHRLESRSRMGMCLEFLKLMRGISYGEIILSGWDHPVMWTAAFSLKKSKNSCVSESSAHESCTTGIKGFAKRVFLRRINRAYVSGKSQQRLVEELGFKGECVVTKGVGVFNHIPQPPFAKRNHVRNFLFVGRFIKVKNLDFLIKCFNKRPDLSLHLVGFGDLEAELKNIANGNVHFLGAVDNKRLPEIYQKMDVFVLPSKSEPWGLVVEEALNNGLPVLVSDKVGCAEEIVNETNGLVFKHDSEESLMSALDTVSDTDFYNSLRQNISALDFEVIESEQVMKYIH